MCELKKPSNNCLKTVSLTSQNQKKDTLSVRLDHKVFSGMPLIDRITNPMQ